MEIIEQHSFEILCGIIVWWIFRLLWRRQYAFVDSAFRRAKVRASGYRRRQLNEALAAIVAAEAEEQLRRITILDSHLKLMRAKRFALEKSLKEGREHIATIGRALRGIERQYESERKSLNSNEVRAILEAHFKYEIDRVHSASDGITRV